MHSLPWVCRKVNKIPSNFITFFNGNFSRAHIGHLAVDSKDPTGCIRIIALRESVDLGDVAAILFDGDAHVVGHAVKLSGLQYGRALFGDKWILVDGSEVFNVRIVRAIGQRKGQVGRVDNVLRCTGVVLQPAMAKPRSRVKRMVVIFFIISSVKSIIRCIYVLCTKTCENIAVCQIIASQSCCVDMMR